MPQRQYLPFQQFLPSVMTVVALAFIVGYSNYSLNKWKRTDFTNETEVWCDKAKTTTRYRVVVPAASTDNARATVEVMILNSTEGFMKERPGSWPLHANVHSLERISVKSGTLSVVVGDVVTTLNSSAEPFTVPKGANKTYWNAGSAPVTFVLTVIPAGPLGERLFTNFAGLSYDYNTTHQINPFQVLALFDAAGIKPKMTPDIAWTLSEKVLLPISKYLGFQPTYAQYSLTPTKDYTVPSSAPAVEEEDEYDDGEGAAAAAAPATPAVPAAPVEACSAEAPAPAAADVEAAAVEELEVGRQQDAPAVPPEGAADGSTADVPGDGGKWVWSGTEWVWTVTGSEGGEAAAATAA